MKTFAVINKKRLYVLKFDNEKKAQNWALNSFGAKSKPIIKEIETDFYEVLESKINYEN